MGDFSNLAPPPRRVPTLTMIQLLFRGTQPKFMRLAWVFATFGVIVWWVGGAVANLPSIYMLFTRVGTTSAKIISDEPTGASEGPRHRVGQRPIYRAQYTYTVKGIHYKGIAYSYGEHADEDPAIRQAHADYVASDPRISRLQGYRRAQTSWFFALGSSLVVLAGLANLALGAGKGILAIGVLRSGVLAPGTGTRRKKIVLTTSRGEERFVFPEFAPMHLSVDSAGQLTPTRSLDLLLAFVGPVIFIAVNLIGAHCSPPLTSTIIKRGQAPIVQRHDQSGPTSSGRNNRP